MGFFKSFFSSETETVRHLDHPKNLEVGDLITFDNSFSLPEQLRDASFEVVRVNTYEYEIYAYHECVLKSGDNKQFNLVYHHDDQEYLSLNFAITTDWVERVFDMEQFAGVFDEGLSQIVEAVAVEPIAQWISPHYRKIIDSQTGYFYSQKLSLSRIPAHIEGEKFQMYQLESVDEAFAVDIEVWEDGDTDVFLTRYFDMSIIKEYWPHEQNNVDEASLDGKR